MTLVAALEAGMKAAGIETLGDLGSHFGVSQGTASKWINGDNVPGVERAGAIATFIGTDEDTATLLIVQAQRQRREQAAELKALREEVVRLRRQVADLERER